MTTRSFIVSALIVTATGDLIGQTHFRFTSNTGNNATVAIPVSSNPSVNGEPLRTGDEIGAFTPDGLCVGAVVWTGVNLALTVWGDDDQTQAIDGMRPGETISYRVWKKDMDTEYPNVTVTYALGNGRYAVNGLYTIATFRAHAPPGAPVPVSPANGATGVPVSAQLGWNTSDFADSYRLQIATTADFSSPVVDTAGLTGTSFQAAALQNATTYYWRVSASNQGGEGDFSEPWSFTTVEAPPGPPLLISPEHGAVNQPLSLVLTWSSVGSAASYSVQVSADQSFQSLLLDESGLADTAFAVGPLSSGTTYYWRVNASGAGGTGEWSVHRSFTTIPAPPGAPGLRSPANQAVDQPLTVSLEWNQSTTADWYRVELSADSTFASTLVNDSTVALSRSVGSLQANKRYFWHVRAGNEGGIGPWSETRNFRTIPEAPTAPVLLAPANAAVRQPRTLTLSWSPSADASDHAVQVSGNASFTSTIVDEPSVTSDSLEVGPFGPSATLYWRVRSRNAGGTSDWSSVWSFTTIANPPAAPTLGTPTNGATDQSTSPRLTWNASAGAESYRIQLSTSPSFTAMTIDTAGITRLEAVVGPLAVSTQYYWRVLAVNDGGASDWSEVRSFRTIPPPPSTPNLTTPANGATDQPTTLILTWESASGAATYHVQVSTGPAFTQLHLNDSTVTGTSKQAASLEAGATYYWRVRARNAGGTSAWSLTRSFSTSGGLPPPPASPALVSPSDGSDRLSVPVTLVWGSSSGASSYDLQVSTDASFSSPVVNETGISTTSRTVQGLGFQTTYHWRVRAANAGGASGWSVVWRFTTAGTPPQAPSLASPPDNGTGISLNTALRWNRVSGAKTFHAQVSVRSDFSTIHYENSALTDTLVQPGGLSNDQQYRWRVRAVNEHGPGAWSSVWSFTTVRRPPTSPQLAHPEDGSPAEPLNPILRWHASANATSYRIQLSRSSSFGSQMVIDEVRTDTMRSVSGLSYATAYYWRVSAMNEGGSSGWTPVWGFRTVQAPPAAPTLVSPAQGASQQPTALELQWNPVSGAISYRVQLSSSSSFTTLFADSSGVTGTRFAVSGLDHGREYHWRVNASNQSGPGPWSSPRNFTTSSGDPLAPQLSSPPNGATGVAQNPVLSWSNVTGATGYDVQVSEQPDFSILAAGATNVSSTSHQIAGLQVATKYFWRVRSRIATGTSSWSTVWNFTTFVPVPAAPALLLPITDAQDIVLQPELIWKRVPGALSYRIEVSTVSDFSTKIADSSGVLDTLVRIGPLQPSTRWYWRVRAANSGGTGQPSEVRSFVTYSPAQRTNVNVTIPYPPASTASSADYRLFGLPGNGGAAVDAVLNGSTGGRWKAYWDNGQPANYLLEVGSAQQSSFGNGRAYWIIHDGPLSVNTTVGPTPVNSAGEASVPLHSGWNIITNPFSVPVAWSEVQVLNGIQVPLWEFESGFRGSDTLRPLSGYYVDNAGGAPFLRIPRPAAQGAPSVPPSGLQPTQDQWTISIELRSGVITDRTTFVGSHRNASKGLDRMDHRRPRPAGSLPSVALRRPLWDPDSDFSSDIRPPVENIEEWDFEVVSPGRAECMLTFGGVSDIPVNFDAFLVDQTAGISVNLRDQAHYKLTPLADRSVLKLVIGQPAAVRELTQGFDLPSELILGTNYPNPFNPATVIPVSLPERAEVHLAIFNTMGQEIAVLHNGPLGRGRYSFVWDTRTTGGSVASGVYIVRLIAGTQSRVHKVLLVK